MRQHAAGRHLGQAQESERAAMHAQSAPPSPLSLAANTLMFLILLMLFLILLSLAHLAGGVPGRRNDRQLQEPLNKRTAAHTATHANPKELTFTRTHRAG